ncbi:hypothetical protein CTEN210_10836 [Chaetoceros tenuissimus]|uniref:Uncharacterized protein n=1 Tax=Chaetoceros tenuissimus TaxID=426638 RepID=A0AAD3D0F1_9STRA|nr:hypothetical protein CTEN210_10836 [Chaetoceros tenuissimus]
MKLGLFNHAIVSRTGHSFWSWMELRVQNISDYERNARSIYLDYKLNHVEAKNQLEEWNSINLEKLNEMREENKELTFELSFPLRSGRYTKDEKEQLKLEKAELKVKIDELAKAQKALKDEIKERKKLLDVVKREYEGFGKKRNWRGLTVRRTIEALLRKHGIDFSAYHGGDLTGRPIQNFCENANQIFEEIQTVLIETVNSPGYSCLANENEVRDVCSRFKQLTILMDGFFSLHMMSRQEFRNIGADAVRTRCIKYVDALQTKWRDLHLSIQAPKFHALSHFETQFVSNEGLGAFHEQFAEIAHRDGERDRKRIGAIRDMQKRASSQSWHRQIGSSQEVQAMKKKFSPPKKRKKNIDKERERNEVRSIVLNTVTNELANNTNTKMKNYWSRN